jgi:predicted dehydrogenase
MEEILRTIVIGYGIQGKKRYKHCGGDFTYYIDPNVETALYKNIREASLDSFDAACVCVPNSEKLEIIRYLLANGKHVLVEKPLWAETQKQLKDLQVLADKNKTVLYTAYNHRFEPSLTELRQAAKNIGKIYSCRIFYGNGTAKLVADSPWRDSGIGIFGEIGSHLLDMVSFIFDGDSFAVELGLCKRHENKTPDHIIFLVKDNNQITVECEATYLSWKNTFTVDVIGEKGSVHVSGLCKWGKSVCEWRERVYPSGVPTSHKISWSIPDPTWDMEYRWFKHLCENNKFLLTRNISDLRINHALNKLVEQSQ